MKPAGLAVPRTRRPAKPGRSADTAPPSRHQATHRHDGVRGRAPAQIGHPTQKKPHMCNRVDAAMPRFRAYIAICDVGETLSRSAAGIQNNSVPLC